MSIAVLVQVYEETRRLAIAGSAVAVGDFRLKKLVAPLEQAGAKAPVFARVAQAVQAVVDSTEATASAALLELATLVNAILYTQGETGAAGEFHRLETTDLGTSDTRTSTRVLKPLLNALASTGSGRLEVVKDAVERGVFKDLRLVKPALNAIDDPYSEVSDLIATKVLPTYGKAILPNLRSSLNLKGRGGHVHRLRLIHALDAEGSRDLIRSALDEGSKEVRIAAIECLDPTGDDLNYLIEQATSKAKEVRAAALRALMSATSLPTDAIGVLKRAIDGADIELMTVPLRATGLVELRSYTLEKASQHLEDTLKLKDPKQQGPAISRLLYLVLSLKERTDADVENFLLRCFDGLPTFFKMKSSPSGNDFGEMLAHVLSRGSTKMRQKLAAAHKSLPAGMLVATFEAARETMSPSEFFKEFNSELAHFAPKRGKKSFEHERALALGSVLTSQDFLYYTRPWSKFEDYDDFKAMPKRELDPRWLDTAIETEAVTLVYALARPGHAKVIKFLTVRLNATKSADDNQLLQTMVRIGHPDATDAIVDTLKKQAKSTHASYVGYWYGDMITQLPKSALPKLEALLPTLPDKMVDQLIESVQALKNKPD